MQRIKRQREADAMQAEAAKSQYLSPRAQRHCTQHKNVFSGKAKLWQLGLGQRGAAALKEVNKQAAFLLSENSKSHHANQINTGLCRLSSHPLCLCLLVAEHRGMGWSRSCLQPKLSLRRRAAAGLLRAKGMALSVCPLSTCHRGCVHACLHVLFCGTTNPGTLLGRLLSGRRGETRDTRRLSSRHFVLCWMTHAIRGNSN